ncbi:MAG: transposase [Liquorilactobacillus ghanensis]
MLKRYPTEFKQNIIDLYQHKIKSAPELAKEYGVGYSTILKWVSGSQKSPVNGLTADEAKAQSKRIKRLEEENLILKKRWGCWQKIDLSIDQIKKVMLETILFR